RATVVVEAPHIDAIEPVPTATELLEEPRNGEKCCLTRTGRPRHRDELAFLHFHGKIAERIGLDDLGPVNLRQAGHLEHSSLESVQPKLNGSALRAVRCETHRFRR